LNYREQYFAHIQLMETDEHGFVEIPTIVLRHDILFPYQISPMTIEGRDNKHALAYALKNETSILCVYNPIDVAPLAYVHNNVLGTECAVPVLDETEEFEPQTMFFGQRRLQIISLMQAEPFPKVRARVIDEDIIDTGLVHGRYELLRQHFEKIIDLSTHIDSEVRRYLFNTKSIVEGAYQFAVALELQVHEKQYVLEAMSVDELLERIEHHALATKTRLEAQESMNKRVQFKIATEQRKLYLQEQMDQIQDELGDDFARPDLNKLAKAIADTPFPKEVFDKAMEELQRLSQMPPINPEATVIRSYIEWLTKIPWQANSTDNYDLKHAEQILDEEHFGLRKVKDRVLEYIAVRKLAKDKMKSPIMCFVGPPGVGKTSLGKSIARALGREFVRVSLGGVRDEAEIRGHRRTYIGSMPGRIIQTLKRAGTTNPVFMLDEIDKLSEDYRGDPASVLLEVLDPEQNNTFVDHYLEVDYDLSDVIFIATANELYPLPEALEDRLEIIDFRTYTEEEKIDIAKRFLIPKQIEAHGLETHGLEFSVKALQKIIRQYTFEAGVRNLEREIAKVCRKTARHVVTETPFAKRITPKVIEKFLGVPWILPTRINREDRIGTISGLVWTSSGGDVQTIEMSLIVGKGGLTMTGQLGDVLQESIQAGHGYIRANAKTFDLPDDDFDNFDIHIHLPEGGIPKDGPSAGVALTIGMISVLTERKIKSDYALTGEVTLRGMVIPVGGIKEKVLAARRNNIKNIILPADNEKDLVDIPRKALADLNITFINHIDEAIDLLLDDAPSERQRDIDAQENQESLLEQLVEANQISANEENQDNQE